MESNAIDTVGGSQPLRFTTDKIYVAGALNAPRCEGYLQNMHRMIHTGEAIREMGASVFVPGNDMIQGIVSGKLEYDDYIQNSMGLLAASDAMALVPGWEDSPGVKMEIEYAKAHGIPVCGCLEAVQMFLNRPRILCIVGESGSGKTMAADYIEAMHGIEMIRSHTDRPKRFPEEDSHTFHTPEEFNRFGKDQMIAYTQWGEYRYCCLHEDVNPKNTYVIDESGLHMLKGKFKRLYKVASLRMHRHKRLRTDAVGTERVARDEGKFQIWPTEFEYNIINDGSEEELHEKLDRIVSAFFGVEG